jgi:hypothetical protein
MVVVADSSASSTGPQLLYQAIGSGNLRPFVDGQDAIVNLRWRTDRLGYGAMRQRGFFTLASEPLGDAPDQVGVFVAQGVEHVAEVQDTI